MPVDRGGSLPFPGSGSGVDETRDVPVRRGHAVRNSLGRREKRETKRCRGCRRESGSPCIWYAHVWTYSRISHYAVLVVSMDRITQGGGVFQRIRVKDL